MGRGTQVRTWVALVLGLATFVAAVMLRGTAHHAAGIEPLPPVPRDAGTHRLLPLPPEIDGSSYEFMRTHPDGTPVTYDACRPIHYVVRSPHLPSYGETMIRQAVAQVSRATGLKFVEDGRTDEPLSFTRDSVQSRYGDRWAPVLIGFSDEKETPDLAGGVMGEGGSEAVAPSGPASSRWVTGTVELDQQDFDRLLPEPLGWERDRAALMHELGHVVGLAHVQNSGEIMYAYNLGVTYFGPGDQHGLRLLGSGLCHHDT